MGAAAPKLPTFYAEINIFLQSFKSGSLNTRASLWTAYYYNFFLN